MGGMRGIEKAGGKAKACEDREGMGAACHGELSWAGGRALPPAAYEKHIGSSGLIVAAWARGSGMGERQGHPIEMRLRSLVQGGVQVMLAPGGCVQSIGLHGQAS